MAFVTQRTRDWNSHAPVPNRRFETRAQTWNVDGFDRVGIGLAGAWGLTRFLEVVMVSATDLFTFSLVTFSLLFAALLFFLLARRATKVDPLVALSWRVAALISEAVVLSAEIATD